MSVIFAEASEAADTVKLGAAQAACWQNQHCHYMHSEDGSGAEEEVEEEEDETTSVAISRATRSKE